MNKTNDVHLAGCLKALGGIIGLLQRDPTEFLQGGAVSDGLSNEEIEDLIVRRKLAATPSRAAGVVFQNDFVFVQKVADAVGFRPVFIRARCLRRAISRRFPRWTGRLKRHRLAGTQSDHVATGR